MPNAERPRVRAAVIPALNEQASIVDVIEAVRTHVDVVVVVDDGSTDDTAQRARAAGATVVSHASNQGVGAAISSGLRHARSVGAVFLIQVDGDGQHDADEVPVLLRALEQGADLVVGTRFERGFEMGAMRRGLLRCFGVAISAKIGVRVSDPTSGFRGFSQRAADVLAPTFPTKYLSDTVEVLYLAAEHELRIVTVPVRMRPRQGGEASVGVLRGVIYTARIVAIILGHSIRRSRRHAL